jgi:hypothetical protein
MEPPEILCSNESEAIEKSIRLQKSCTYPINLLTFPVEADAICNLLVITGDSNKDNQNVDIRVENVKTGNIIFHQSFSQNEIPLWFTTSPFLACTCSDYRIVSSHPLTATGIFYPAKERYRILSHSHAFLTANGAGVFLYQQSLTFHPANR